jgi:hypothetical protein
MRACMSESIRSTASVELIQLLPTRLDGRDLMP